MATIRSRGGRYHVQIRKKGYPSVTQSFKKEADAKAWARKIESQMERGEWHDRSAAEETTLADVLRKYRDTTALTLRDCDNETAKVIKACLAANVIPDVTTPTRARIDVILKRNPQFEKISMLRINQELFNDYVDNRYDDEVSGSTINRELSVISSAINRAIAAGLPAENPIEKIDRPKENKGRVRRLSAGELIRLLHELRPRERQPNGQYGSGTNNCLIRWLVRFAIETAMRRGEMLGLCWRDIDIARRTAYLANTKNGDERYVPLSTRGLRVLAAAKLLATESDRVFPVTKEGLRKAFERARERAEINDLHFHDLRHEAISRLASRFHMHELTAITGHKDPRMLIRYYHPDASDLAKKLS